jgi:hypothetical protein
MLVLNMCVCVYTHNFYIKKYKLYHSHRTNNIITNQKVFVIKKIIQICLHIIA